MKAHLVIDWFLHDKSYTAQFSSRINMKPGIWPLRRMPSTASCQPTVKSHHVHFLTCSEVFFKRINFPSTSISSMETFPVAEAEWEMLTLLLASDSSTSILLLFLLVVRTLRLDEARETVTREDGLGVSLSLNQRTQDTHKPHFLHFFLKPWII